MNLRGVLEDRLRRALGAAGAPADSPALVMPAARAEFGDYQANGVMAAAKKLKTNPRTLAEKALEILGKIPEAESIGIAGPGFINIKLSSKFLAQCAAEALGDERLGVPRPARPQTVVVDYSGPNLAKEMHVGHLRSTIIGDALARVLDFIGDNVIRQNHVGDWGTQFGMLIAHMNEEIGDSASPDVSVSWNLPDLETFYVDSKQRYDTDPEFAAAASDMVVQLQRGDEQVGKSWRTFRDESLEHCKKVYERLGVLLTPKDIRGESEYNDDLPKVIAELKAAGLVRESRGAQCVFLEEFKGKDGQPLPVIVQKSDGGYLYATTDLAAIRYRVRELHADRILYVTDSRQALHFEQVFAVARAAGFAPTEVSLEHVAFGTMLGADNRPFKTREGGTVKLMDLLDEAVRKARELVEQKNPDLADAEKGRVAEKVGIGAVKYADLSHNRTSDYVFSWDKMLSLEGNTAPYMQYAYARICSIFRKGEINDHEGEPAEVMILEPAERTLSLKLAQFPETVEAVARDCLPHLLCNYLYELAGAFMGFYESCPVLKADPPIRASRVGLCRLTARIIKVGLGLLGIETIEQM